MKTYCRKSDVFQAVTFDGSNLNAVAELLGGTSYTVVSRSSGGNTVHLVEYRGTKDFVLTPGVIVTLSLYGTVTDHMPDSTDTWVEVEA